VLLSSTAAVVSVGQNLGCVASFPIVTGNQRKSEEAGFTRSPPDRRGQTAWIPAIERMRTIRPVGKT
jgi:hypothetical protein